MALDQMQKQYFNPKQFSILVIEENQSDLNLLEQILSKEDYRLGFASNVMQAIDLMNAFNFDLVLLSLYGSELDDFKAPEEIKNKIPNIQLMICIHSMNDRKILDRALSEGVSDFLQKPYDAHEVRLRVKLHLELNRAKYLMRKKKQTDQTLLQMLCHDVRPPLANISDILELLAQDPGLLEGLLPELRSAASSCLGAIENVRLLNMHSV